MMRAPSPDGKKSALPPFGSVIRSHLCQRLDARDGPAPKAGAALEIYQEDVDRGFERAKSAGLKVVMRRETCSGATASPSCTTAGNQWVLAKHVKDLSPAR